LEARLSENNTESLHLLRIESGTLHSIHPTILQCHRTLD
jgi:hypothetical protein